MTSIITNESIEAWNLYNRLDGAKHETYESYCELPARWIEQMDVIEDEISETDEAKQNKRPGNE